MIVLLLAALLFGNGAAAVDEEHEGKSVINRHKRWISIPIKIDIIGFQFKWSTTYQD